MTKEIMKVLDEIKIDHDCPIHKIFKENDRYVVYSIHENQEDEIPSYVVFHKNTGKLVRVLNSVEYVDSVINR